MTNYETLSAYTKDELIELIAMYAKNTLALDGVWFQSVEQECGMDAAMHHDVEAWRRFTVTEARRIRSFLKLGKFPGVDGLAQALRHRFNASIHPYSIQISGNTLTYTVLNCRVQAARSRKGMPLHPCKPAGFVEYEGFAKTIDPRFSCECLSCHPDVTDTACACKWRFTLEDA